ncbi:MAG: hypothetical protein ACREA0_22905 [bacterium]
MVPTGDWLIPPSTSRPAPCVPLTPIRDGLLLGIEIRTGGFHTGEIEQRGAAIGGLLRGGLQTI